MLTEHFITVGELLDVAAERLFRKFPFDGAIVSLYDSSSNSLTGVAGFGLFQGAAIRHQQGGRRNPFAGIRGPCLITPKETNGSTVNNRVTPKEENHAIEWETPCDQDTADRMIAVEGGLRPLWVSNEFLRTCSYSPLIMNRLPVSQDTQLALPCISQEAINDSFEVTPARFGENHAFGALDIGSIVSLGFNGSSAATGHRQWMYMIPNASLKSQKGVLRLIPDAYPQTVSVDRIEEIWSFPLEYPGPNGNGHFVGELTFNNPTPAVHEDERIRNLILGEGNRERRLLAKLASTFCQNLAGGISFERNVPVGFGAEELLSAIRKITDALGEGDPTTAAERVRSLSLATDPQMSTFAARLASVLSTNGAAIESLISCLAHEQKRVRTILQAMILVMAMLAVELALAWVWSK